ncbi:DNA polymerase III subunit delta [Candidatus Arcticimaribacter forsetii]|uniref:DNA polymerase III subunit delta n=1 Tax=Candidatus Arcticimaribacter forsetii TaxID=2820661 RepID=UPI00207793D1|nr:DNA polymerase III subunit delta [Candidatus Arcticimaribacter forsetii]MDB2325611.1 DNA polymerase III subunit delta [Flavobacteriaceae bacterium]MDB4674448.1 DNA polymerase III subunit delta [Flavobacteriaceae bacterium]
MKDINQILSSIKKGDFAPVYLLMGSEPFFIDQVTKVLSTHVVEEHAKDFDSTIFYGKESLPEQIIEIAKRFPMMGTHQLVIVREAQSLDKKFEDLVTYLENPQSQTVLVLCYKLKNLDKRKKTYKAIAKNGVILETKPLYDNQVAAWIKDRGLRYGLNFHPNSTQLIASFLGTDLGKIDKELEKLASRIQQGEEITPALIEKHIGYSKDFNSFELKKSLGKRDLEHSFRIIKYMASNSKKHPVPLTIIVLFNFFQKLLLFHGVSSPSQAQKVLGVSPYFLKDYEASARFYSMKQISKVIEYIKEADLKSKGVGAQNLPMEELLKELVIKIVSV